MGGPVKGEYYHFRCDRHAPEETEGRVRVSQSAAFRCDQPRCDLPARAYWFTGEKFAKLTMNVKPEFWIYG